MKGEFFMELTQLEILISIKDSIDFLSMLLFFKIMIDITTKLLNGLKRKGFGNE